MLIGNYVFIPYLCFGKKDQSNALIMKKILFLLLTMGYGLNMFGADVNVYFGTGEDGIYFARFDSEKGKLTQVERVADINSPGFLALHPDKDKLYAVGKLDGEAVVTGYHINMDGSLKQFTMVSSPTGQGAHISVHPSGKFLLTAQYSGGTVQLFPLDENGMLGEAKITRHEGGSNVVPSRQKAPHPHWCGYSPDGKYAFVPDLGMDGIVIYNIDLEHKNIFEHGFAKSVPGGGPRHMRFSTDGRFIYCLNELTLSITTFRYDPAAGTATLLNTTPTLSEEVKEKEDFNSAAEILVHPSGKFVYSSNRGHDSVTSFSTDQGTGELTQIEVEPIRGAWPRNINMDASGRWLLAAGAHSNTVSVFAIDESTGQLKYQRNSIINVPSPICILFVQ